MNNKRGISLIVLVITIVVMIILASAIILSLSGNGVIFKTNKAKFQNDMATMKEELSVYISNKEVETNGAYNSDNLSANKDSLVEEGATVEGKTILDIVKSMDKKYIGKIDIVNGKLKYTGSNLNEIKWSDEILEGIRGYDLAEQNVEQSNTIKLKDSINTSLANYRIYGNGTSLPEEYQQVEYIQTQQDCYIRIENFKRTTFKTKVRCTSQLVTYESLPQKLFEFGAVASKNNFSLWERNDGYYASIFGKEVDVRSSNMYEKHTIELEATSETTAVFKENDKVLLNISGDFVGYEGNISLFMNYPSLTRQYLGKVYDITVWQDDEKVYELIPCYRKSDGEIGMYDLVNNVFYTNQGTGEFLKGKDVGSVGDYVVDMNFDNKWKQGPTYGIDVSSYYNIRVKAENLIKSEEGVKYKISSDLPDNMQFAAVNGTYIDGPYTSKDCVYDSGWQDDDLSFTSTVDGNILIAIRYKNNSKIVPEDVANYEIKVEKYANESEVGGQYVIPINVSGINLHNYKLFEYTQQTINGITFTPLKDGSFHIKGKLEDTSITTSYRVDRWNAILVKAGTYWSKPQNSDGIGVLFGVYKKDGSFWQNINSTTFKSVTLNKEAYVGYCQIFIIAGTTREFDEIVYPQLTKGTTNYSYEPYVEPKTYNIYLDEPLRKIGNYVDYIDFRSQEVVRNVEVVDGVGGQQILRGLDTPVREKISIPNVMLNEGTNIIEVLTKAQPSKIEALYYKK